MYGIEPRYNKFFDITNIIQKPKRKIYLDRTNYNVNTRQKINTEQIKSTNPLILMVMRQQPFSQRLIICHRHWHYSILTEVTCVTNQSQNYDLDITNFLVVSPQICYIEVFDITNPPFNEHIWPVPSDFVKSRFHCM